MVAAEVRNLAQRSAAAASEIKGLIGRSVKMVNTGSKLVGEAGLTVDGIVTAVKQLADIMSEIALTRKASQKIPGNNGGGEDWQEF